MTYLNVPDNISEMIERDDVVYFEKTYRGLYHLGNPDPSDFLPTFVDKQQQKILERMRSSGPMAASVIGVPRRTKSDYCVSLFKSYERAKTVLWGTESRKKDHPALACGPTLPSKGKSFPNSNEHVSYFLYNYETNNPFVDFVTIEEANNE